MFRKKPPALDAGCVAAFPRDKRGTRVCGEIMRHQESSASGRRGHALAGRNLRGQHLSRRLDIDERIDLEFGRDDIGPFVQDAVKLVVVLDVEHRDGAAADPRIDVAASA